MLILAIAAFESIKASPLPQKDGFENSHDGTEWDELSKRFPYDEVGLSEHNPIKCCQQTN